MKSLSIRFQIGRYGEVFRRLTFFLAFAIVVGAIGFVVAKSASADTRQLPGSRFRIGEKLTYSVSFGKFDNAAYAETSVGSRGKISGKDAVELQSKVKTLQVVSAAFVLFDESRTVYAAPDTGLPLYIQRSV